MSSPAFLSNLFPSVPRPLRDVFESALQVNQIRDLHDEAVHRSRVPLSRSALELLDVRIRTFPGELEGIPQTGPLVIVANHPFGIVDGLMLDALLFSVRKDLKILANSFIANAEEIGERCIPVDVFRSRTSSVNLGAVRLAKRWLREGHALALFPAGEVSHWRTDQRCISDSPWSTLAAGLAIQTQAPVAPIYFGGTNSVFFQLSGLIHPRLRTMQLPGELLKKRGATIDVRIGSLVHPADLARCGSPKSATAYLRARTYMLAHRNQEKTQGLWEFHNKPPALDSHAAPIAPETPDIAAEIDTLEGRGCKLLENASYVVYAEQGERIPRVLREIGRLRELTFRTAGEGTGRSLDLDEFEKYYTHLILWHKQKSCICGAYRMAWTEDVLPIYGKNGLYTSTLFAYEREFFRVLGPAVELGRSFIRPEFQRDYAPLLMLWQAVGRCVAARPQAPVLFGAVSISANYSDAAVKLMVEYLRQRRLRADLAPLVRPRRPFRPRVTYAAEICEMAARLGDIEELAKPLSDIGGPSHVPVLLRHYVRLGGRVTGFHVDRNFSNAIDALLVVDLRETAPKLLVKYMGPGGAAEFMRRPGYGACA